MDLLPLSVWQLLVLNTLEGITNRYITNRDTFSLSFLSVRVMPVFLSATPSITFVYIPGEEQPASLDACMLRRWYHPSLFYLLRLILGTFQILSLTLRCRYFISEVIAKVSFLFLKWRIKDLDSRLGESTTFQTFFMALIPLSPAYSKTNL